MISARTSAIPATPRGVDLFFFCISKLIMTITPRSAVELTDTTITPQLGRCVSVMGASQSALLRLSILHVVRKIVGISKPLSHRQIDTPVHIIDASWRARQP